MELPVQITYRELDPSDALTGLIREEAAKLDRFFDRIVSCRVLVEREQRHLRVGAPFRVRIDIGVPGDELTIDAVPSVLAAVTDDEGAMRRKRAEVDAMHKDPALAVRDAFRRARRRIQDYARRTMGPHVRSSIR
ncbi:MAG TPA: HPF/RaiA family ribosome-associated protein [Candidatus Baltobacteraceae bacterium]|nr:HPF/RaiA family ribosome-associated protein [Candidatus Baltobacteraceae bacterium]